MPVSPRGQLLLDDDEIEAIRHEDRVRRSDRSRGCLCGEPTCRGAFECAYRVVDEPTE